MNMLISKKLFLVVIVLAALQHSPLLSASLITLEPVRSGELHRYAGCDYPSGPCYRETSHSVGLDGLRNWLDIDFTIETRGYLIYDLSGVAGSVESAGLQLDIDVGGRVDFPDDLSIYTKSTTMVDRLALLPEGDISNETFADFWYKDVAFVADSFAIRLGDDAVYNSALTSTGLDQLNGAGRYFALLLSASYGGVSYDTNDLKVSFNEMPQLILDVSDTKISAPAMSILVLMGWIRLIMRRRKRP